MKTETMQLDSGTYEVRELSMLEIMPLLEGDSKTMGTDLAKIAVFKDGQPMGDALLDLGFSEAQQLMSAVNRVNGMGITEGKD